MSAQRTIGRLAAATRIPRTEIRLQELGALRWLLPLALLHGLVYLVLTPPWQHYDEPGHFLYAAEIAAGDVLEPGAQSAELSREIADSMVRHQFLDGNFRPSLFQSEPVRLGEDQRVHPPLYYAFVAGFLKPARHLGIDTQLFLVRWISLALYALTIVTAWRITTVVLPDEPVMHGALPLMVLLNPAFVDLMIAVNNDVLLNFALTGMLLGAVLLIRNGVHPTAILLTVVSFGVAIAVKRTAIAALPIVALSVLWVVFRGPVGPRATLIALLLCLVAGLASLQRVPISDGAGSSWTLTARPWLASLDRSYLRLDLDAWVQSVSNVERSLPHYPLLLQTAFTSFWARFGWSDIALPVIWEQAFAVLVVAAVVGLVVGAVREAPSLPLWQQRCVWLFVGVVVVACIALAARLHPLPPSGSPIYVPRGRYMFWAILPVIWLLALGLQWLTPPSVRRFSPWVLVAFFALADISALAAIAAKYGHL